MNKIIVTDKMPKRGLIEQLAPKEPSTMEQWRAVNHVAMVPDRGFTKQLKKLDPELEVRWDWGSNKWEIWRVPRNGKKPFHMLTVRTDKGDYRELGTDILIKLQFGDPWRYSQKQLEDYLIELDLQTQRRKAKDFRNKIESITKDNLNRLRGVLSVQVPRVYRIGRAISGKD